MAYPFAQRIGIWYLNREWAEDIYQRMCNDIPPILILGTDRNRNITMKDGISIQFIPCDAIHSRGCRANLSYIEDGMTQEYYRTVVLPCTTLPDSRIYIVRNYGDIRDKTFIKPDSNYWTEKINHAGYNI